MFFYRFKPYPGTKGFSFREWPPWEWATKAVSLSGEQVASPFCGTTAPREENEKNSGTHESTLQCSDAHQGPVVRKPINANPL